MKYITATSHMADAIYDVLLTTIKTIYPYYYPAEVVDFFCRHHSKEHILEGIASGNMGVLMDNDVIVGTGCYDGNHIAGVYVLPSRQNRGCGSYIMNCLEAEIAKEYDTVTLDASLSAVFLYEHRGYKTVGHGIYELENGVKLVYEVMDKRLDSARYGDSI
ncbi:MAG: GNAT family N-acetyltransferase [Lachnospiraceae bacterium]|nr:GNAT family N-acetyltransferase [Lachnospiraceae bacterium]